MSLLGLFDIGKSALATSQQALTVVSNNIANANTPGYSRQEIIMEITNPVESGGDFIGRGVHTGGIRRTFDSVIHKQLISQKNNYGKSTTLEQGLSFVEQVLNEAQGLGLSNSLNDYSNAWQDLTSDPDSKAARTALLEKSKALVQTSQSIEGSITDLVKRIKGRIEDVASDVNTLTSNIAELNDKIISVEAGANSRSASMFRDQREEAMRDLAELMDYDWYEDSDGGVFVLAGGQSLVSGNSSYNLSTQIDATGDTALGSNAVYLNGTNITSSITKGELGGLIEVRSDIEDNSLHDLRKLVATVVSETNALHYAGYDRDGDTTGNFFDVQSAVYVRDNSTASSGVTMTASIVDASQGSLVNDEYTLTFSSSTAYSVTNNRTGASVSVTGDLSSSTTDTFDGITISFNASTATSGSTFLISPLRNAIADFGVTVTDTDDIAASDSATTSQTGNNVTALAIADKMKSNISSLGSVTMEDFYSSIVTESGTLSRSALGSLAFNGNLMLELESRRQSVSGVSLDEEAANMIRFQRAFEAGARMINITDELLELVINL
ncbi:MAG: flagellar hook-associated protein FlgK [Nitrospira sp.]|nr:flagellar hook-associated protein FlgK [Nitrospira sp.]